MLKVSQINKAYHKKNAVAGLSFLMMPGEITGLIGPNGAGKSTTVSMIATLLKPDSGSILFEGEDIVKNPEVIRKHLGYVPQDIALYESLTGWDNLSFFGSAYHVKPHVLRERIKIIRDQIGFTEELLHRKVKEYSGGMKRRLNIGVALLNEPKLVILDEPTVGIDIKSRKQILNTIQMLKEKGTAVLYVGHYMEEVERLCDRVLIMNQGECILNAKLSEVLRPKGKAETIEKLYEMMNIG